MKCLRIFLLMSSKLQREGFIRGLVFTVTANPKSPWSFVEASQLAKGKAETKKSSRVRKV